jgi:hypothetical protein
VPPSSSSSYDDWGDARATTSGREDWARRDGEDDFFFFDDARGEEARTRTLFDDDFDFDFDFDGDETRRRARQRDGSYRGDGRRSRSRSRSRSREGSGYDASVNVLRLAYEALTSISAAFTKSLDVLLPSSVPMYVIRLIVAAGWCTFILASASRLVYGVVVIGAVLSLAVALGSNNGETSKRSSAWAYEYATDSSASGRRRREDFDELRRARMREERRRRGDAYDASDDVFVENGDAEEDVPTFTFDSRAFERGAEVFSETIASVRTNEAFRAAEDVTKEVRLWGDEALDEFKNAFNLNAGDYDFDFDDDVADVEFKAPSSVKRERVQTKEREDRSSNVVEIIDVDALETRHASEVERERAERSPHVSFDDWLDTSSAPRDDERDARSTAPRDEPFTARSSSFGSQSSSAFRDAFADGFDVASAPTTARNWWNQFISGEFNGDFQADLIDVSFANDGEEGREEEGNDDDRV